jgi:prepilin-type N-terminal cleavage/methylation domain-containing protein
VTYKHSSGFNLLEMSVAIATISLLAAAGITVATQATQRQNFNEVASTIENVEDALLIFIENNWRLPCPDTSGTETAAGSGLENCAGTTSVGQVPFKTLGLGTPSLDPWRRPLLYAIDRRLTVTGKLHRYDFCKSLRFNALSSTTAYLHTDAGSPINLGLFLLSGGADDSDKNGSRFDQIASSGLSWKFIADDFSGSGITGDQYAAVSLFELSGRVRCPGSIISTNTLENEVIAANLTLKTIDLSVERTQGNIKGVEQDIANAEVAIIQGSVSVVSAAATLINSIGQGLAGNVPATVAAAAAVVGAAAAVSAITAAAIDLTKAKTSRTEMVARKAILNTYSGDIANVCEGATTTLENSKGSAVACINP